MAMSADNRSDEFLKISGQFKLGALVTESSHPVTAHLSETARQDAAAGLKLLFDVDGDVIRKFREFVESDRAREIKEALVHSLKNCGRIFFTGCGATGRLSILLDSVWRDFWQQRRAGGFFGADDFENRTFSVMAGGDYALIKSVEGFEDFAAFGRKQLRDLGVRAGDVVFAITEGGETSFVIGTAWEGVDAGAKVYFLYNNPDDILCRTVERSREIIGDPRIEKMNLTTGPMAVAGSTRMQATSIQLCVMLTILEMAVRELAVNPGIAPASENGGRGGGPDTCPREFLARLEELYAVLKSPGLLAQLAKLVVLEETVYRTGHKNNYFADRFGIDVLTDTTERSPTYCTPPFRKAGDTTAAESWAYLFLPQSKTPDAWHFLLRRAPRCVEWSEGEVRGLKGNDRLARTMETIRKIGPAELMQFKIGLDGVEHRPPNRDDGAVVIAGEVENPFLRSPDGFFHVQLETAQKAGARTGLIYFCRSPGGEASATGHRPFAADQHLPASAVTVLVPVPGTDFLLDGVTRVAVKLVMNALSTCTMVRLGRVMGNTMIWVVPSNLKLIDRATRYIGKLTGLTYEQSNRLLFEVLEHVEPRMEADQAYPPVVGLAVMRARHHCSNAEAERKLREEIR